MRRRDDTRDGLLLLGVGVHSPLAARERGDVHESAVVENALLGTTLGGLLLLLLFDLRSLRLDFAGTGERSVNCRDT